MHVQYKVQCEHAKAVQLCYIKLYSRVMSLLYCLWCTPLLVEKAGTAPDMTLRFTMRRQVCRWENHPGFETHGEGHMKSKI